MSSIPDSLPPSGGARESAIVGWGRRTFSALSVRNYRLYYWGQGLSLVGTWVRRTALGWLVYSLTGSMAKLGTVSALTLLPMFVLSPLAGSLADRFDKRRFIIFSQVLAMLVSALIALVVWMGNVQMWHIMVLATLAGVAFALEVPARQSFIVEMVGREQLLNAIALNSALFNLTRIAGPAVAGYLIDAVDIAMCFALDAASYLVVIASLLMMRLEKTPPLATDRSHFHLLVEGARFSLKQPTVRLVLFLLTASGFFGWAFQSLLPGIAQGNLHLDAKRYGALMTMFGVGAVAGALATASRTKAEGRLGQLFFGAWTMTFGVAAMAVSRDFVTMCISLVLSGFGAVLFTSVGNTMIQLSVDNNLRGRVMGMWAVAFGGSVPVGSWMLGHLADYAAALKMESLPYPLRDSLFAYAFLGQNGVYLAIGTFAVVLFMCTLIARVWLEPSARCVEQKA